MDKSLFVANNDDLQGLSTEEHSIYIEIVDLLMSHGLSQKEAEAEAYISFFTK